MAITIGIAGFGKHALGRILPVVMADPRLQLAAIWARNPLSQRQLREQGFHVVGDFANFLATPMDVVYVASPTGLHFEHTAAILKAGHHAWVEKPIATNLKDVHRLVSMAEAGNTMLAEAFMFPWHAQAAMIRRVLQDGTLGRLRQVSLAFCFPHLAADNFRYEAALGGGAFLDHACYLTKALDIYLGGSWSVLGGCLDYAQQAVDIAGAAQLRRDADGVVASLNWGFGSVYINEMQFVGERARLQVESAFTKPASRSCNLYIEDGKGQWTTLEPRREDPYARMLDGFIELFGTPADWHQLREDILWHAGNYFALYAGLKQCR